MTTRMVHPLHGATHAYDTGEVERLKGHGWSVEMPKPAEPVAPLEVVSEEVVPERKKPGPKPKAK